MVRSLWTAATGMQAQQMNIEKRQSFISRPFVSRH